MKRFLLLFLISFAILLSGCDQLGNITDNSDTTYSVTFYDNNGTKLGSVDVVAGETVLEPTEYTFDGYSFEGWFSDSSRNVAYDFSQGVNGDLNLYGSWELVSFTVTFHIGDDTQNETVNYGEEIPFPTILEVTGSVFDGWYTDATFDTLLGDTTVVTSIVELYAKYEQLQYQLQVIDANNNVIVQEKYLYLDDLSFLHEYDWDDDVETTQLLYTDDSFTTIFDENAMPDYDLTLYLGEPLTYTTVPMNISDTLSIVVWGGSGTYYTDIGHMNLDPDDLSSQTDAKYYAVAKAFNEIYPNITINLFTYQGGPNDGGRIWSQVIDEVESMSGDHPSIWVTNDVAGELQRGSIFDISTFSADPMYKTLNPAVLQLMNIQGFQTGLPEYIIPWGIYVNRELAEQYNIDIPSVNWDIDDYTDFIAHKIEDEYYGSMDSPIRLIETGVTTIQQQLSNYDGTGSFINLNSDEVRSLIPYLSKWNENSIWGGEQNPEFMDSHWWWSYKFFVENKLLTLESDPWMLGDCATPSVDQNNPYWGSCKSSDWDIYPRPATDYVDNTIGIVLDPMVVYNYCLEDGDTTCSESELLSAKTAYTFLMFYAADSRSWDARANQEFFDPTNGKTTSSMNDSFPITTGDLFDEQMGYWYSVSRHARYADQELMPGFAEVTRIFKQGQFWDVSDKAFPYTYYSNGQLLSNMYEWTQYWNPDFNGGVSQGDSNFDDTLLSQLPGWNTIINQRFEVSYQAVLDAIEQFYSGEGGTDPNINLDLAFVGTHDWLLTTGDEVDLLEGVQVFGSNEQEYTSFLTLRSDDCAIEGSTLLSLNPGHCHVTYLVVVNGTLYTHDIVVTYQLPETDPSQIMMEWTFDEESDLDGWNVFMTSGGNISNDMVSGGIWSFEYTSSDVTYGTRWDYMGIPFEQGKTYQIELEIASSIDSKLMQLQIGELLPSDPWFNDFLSTEPPVLELFTGGFRYIYTFTMIQDNPNGGILLEFGDIPGSEGMDGTIYISSITIFES